MVKIGRLNNIIQGVSADMQIFLSMCLCTFNCGLYFKLNLGLKYMHRKTSLFINFYNVFFPCVTKVFNSKSIINH